LKTLYTTTQSLISAKMRIAVINATWLAYES